MSQLIASQKVIQHYLDALLTEEPAEQVESQVALADSKKAELNRLLASAVEVAPPPQPVNAQVVSAPPTAPATAVISQATASPIQQTAAVNLQVDRAVPVAERIPPVSAEVAAPTKAYRQERFQALFFSVAGLKLAVPLTELGGIHELTTTTALPGSPQWYQGVMLHRGQKILVVDTARWVMPEQYTAKLAAELQYQYVIMLGASHWALTCELLIDTINLEPDEIKWREHEGKRPWMAGLIKEQKCVLVDVEQLINMLDQGLDVNAVTSIANKEL